MKWPASDCVPRAGQGRPQGAPLRRRWFSLGRRSANVRHDAGVASSGDKPQRYIFLCRLGDVQVGQVVVGVPRSGRLLPPEEDSYEVVLEYAIDVGKAGVRQPAKLVGECSVVVQLAAAPDALLDLRFIGAGRSYFL